MKVLPATSSRESTYKRITYGTPHYVIVFSVALPHSERCRVGAMESAMDSEMRKRRVLPAEGRPRRCMLWLCGRYVLVPLLPGAPQERRNIQIIASSQRLDLDPVGVRKPGTCGH